ncbi:MAG: restriction endonuclease subunit S [Anaerolineae bacterium]|nr:restriction endonuclease subunit S [Anaerolineae bacterium]
MKIPQRPLSQVAAITMGTSPKGDTYNQDGTGLPLLNGPTEFGPTYPNCTLFTTDSKRECRPGDLIFCVRGSTTGRMNWADRVYSLGRGVCSIRGETKIDTRFIKYCLDWKLEALLKYAGGGTFPNLTQNSIREFEIPFPRHRRKIATILSAYDDLIENNLRRIKILEEMAQNLYREWFVKFRFPGHRHARFTDSPLGPIPEGWEVQRLGEVLELNYGKALKQEDRRGGDVPVYGSSGVVGHHDVPLVNGPGIVVGRKGNVGSIFWSDEDFYPIDTAYFVTSKMPLRFLFYDLQTKNFLNNDAAVPGLNRNQAYSLETVTPPTDILTWFCQFADDFERQAAVLRLQNTTLRRTRDLLLPKLISGAVDVSELDIAVGEEATA